MIMTLAAFFTAVLRLLLTPGPTNTLMGLAGASAGLPRVARLLPAEILGYLTTILPLAFMGHSLLADFPVAAQAIKLAAAAWVMILAVKLWGQGSLAQAGDDITARRVYATTVLNPKAMIIALVLLPAPAAPDFAARLALFCMTAASVAMIWGGAGSIAQLGQGGMGRMRVIQRAASVWLAIVSVMLVAGVVRA
jgi:threonine/homoserine/homoserine lactone efflux protein